MTRQTAFRTDEMAVSQLPAIILLAKLGWKPLATGEANTARKGDFRNVILEDITRDYLRRQVIRWGEHETRLNEDNIATLMDRLTRLPPVNYGKQAEEKWDLLCLPQGVEQVVDGARRSLNARFIDFDNPGNNVFHMVPEFRVERSRSQKHRIPDIVLFVNGIPMAVIENKSVGTDVEQGVSQNIRNQKADEIRHLYTYAQVVLSVNKNENRYGTTGTPAKLWNTWIEKEFTESHIRQIVDAPLAEDDRAVIFSDDFATSENHMDRAEEGRRITDQDWALVGLCSPKRLLQLTREFILFEGPHKVIARFQQFDAVRKTLARIEKGVDKGKGEKRGGVIWHTQGSGKSLTMVMLARSLISHSTMNNARIVLVTDRVDLDKQIKGTFKDSGMAPKRANKGMELVKLIKEGQTSVITTIINKFETTAKNKIKDESEDVFLLVDEGHRSQHGRFSAQMRRTFPNATFIAFTGTPIARKDRNTMAEFGPIIDTYTMRDAVAHKAVVPLIYEGRLVKPDMDKNAIDEWFKRITDDLSKEEVADLKQKYAKANMLSRLDKVIACRAYDISEHFRRNYHGTGLKGQIVAPSKAAAIKYKEHLDDIGHIKSAVLISSSDDREGHNDVEEMSTGDEVQDFLKEEIARWGDEEQYNEGLINTFKKEEQPELIIVVHKLLTGFDAPRNTVLYLTRPLREHTLLQAIARVNRIFDPEQEGFETDKDFGYIIDYENILEDLDEAFSHYDALAGYEESDLEGLMDSIGSVIEKIPARHGDLLDVFNTVGNSADEEEYEVFLGDDETRHDFYEKLTAFTKVMKTALGSAAFYDEVDEDDIQRYKRDLARFINLRTSVKRRYAEEVDFSEYEKRIEKMLHNHISATKIELVVPPINVFDMASFDSSVDKFNTDRAKADHISSLINKTIDEKMGENPAFYRKLSEMLQEVIDKFIGDWYDDAEFLEKMRGLHGEMVNEGASTVPEDLADDPHAAAFHGYLLTSPLEKAGADDDVIIAFAKKVSEIFRENKIIGLFERQETLKTIKKKIDEYIFNVLVDEKGLEISDEDMDEIELKIMDIAGKRMAHE